MWMGEASRRWTEEIDGEESEWRGPPVGTQVTPE